MKCHYKSERQERMMDLTVEIEGDIGKLEDALRRFTSAEILDGDNKYQCGRFVSLCFLIKLLSILFVWVYSSTCFLFFFSCVCVCVGGGGGVGAQQERTISTFLSKHVFKLSSAMCWLFVLTKILYCSGTLQT
jgi:hypothetical protein